MDMNPVKSKLLKAIGYDPATQTLRAEYHNGSHYDHEGVTPEKYAALMAAESQGKHFLANIKNQHPWKKFEAEKQSA